MLMCQLASNLTTQYLYALNLKTTFKFKYSPHQHQ